MKSQIKTRAQYKSLPTRAAWIEIEVKIGEEGAPVGRCPHGQRGLKFFIPCPISFFSQSLPTRAAWIEIIKQLSPYISGAVAAHTGSVD